MAIEQTYHTFTYRDQPVYYRKTGKGPPLLLLHGWGSESKVMLPVARRLASLRTCYIPDLPGFGKTDPPPVAWSVDEYTDLIQSFIDSLEEQPVDLLVHSFGGRIALKLCARPSSQKTIGKVLIADGAGMRPHRSWRYYAKKYTARLLKAPFNLLPGRLRDKALKRLRGSRIWKSLGSSDYRQLNGVMRQTFVKTVSEHLGDLLPDIPHETLLVWGDLDSATPVEQGQRMEAGLPNAALVTIDQAGHYPFIDRPTHFARIARAFFAPSGDEGKAGE